MSDLTDGVALSDRVDGVVKSRADEAEILALMASCDGYVVQEALKWVGKLPHMEMDDLVQVGRIAVWKAALRFEPERELKFVTYASRWVRNCLLYHVQMTANTIRVPRSDRRGSAALRGMKPVPMVFLDAVMGEDGDEMTLHAVVAAPEGAAVDCGAREMLALALGALDARTARVLRERFGEEKSCQQIANGLGISKQRVQQLATEGLEQVRRWMRRHGRGEMGLVRMVELKTKNGGTENE